MARKMTQWDAAIDELENTLDFYENSSSHYSGPTYLEDMVSEGEPDVQQALQRLHISELLKITAYQNKLLEGIHDAHGNWILHGLVFLLVAIEGARYFS